MSMLEFKRDRKTFEWVRTGKDIVVIGYDAERNIGVLIDKIEIVSMSDEKFKELIENLEYAIEKIKEIKEEVV